MVKRDIQINTGLFLSNFCALGVLKVHHTWANELFTRLMLWRPCDGPSPIHLGGLTQVSGMISAQVRILTKRDACRSVSSHFPGCPQLSPRSKGPLGARTSNERPPRSTRPTCVSQEQMISLTARFSQVVCQIFARAKQTTRTTKFHFLGHLFTLW